MSEEKQNRRKVDWRNGSGVLSFLDKKTLVLILALLGGTTGGGALVNFLTPSEAEKRIATIEQKLEYDARFSRYKENQLDKRLENIEQELKEIKNLIKNNK
ncbi:MAG TPA: hypothetical protein VIH28_10125 [Ignavibacteriaceae bacterium]